MAKLEVRNLRISFRTNSGAVRAVRDISFELHQGQTLAIVGESGSGKSVTARAIMGILASNAMVDNGEIIYDGQDLLKISEDDFHTLRGHRLAMIFQDPLSALNPVMRIGRQLTEAMLLNNRERRKDGRKRFKRMISLLEENIGAADAAQGKDTRAATAEKIRRFRAYTDRGVALQAGYSDARDALTEAGDYLDELRLELKRNNPKTVRETLGRLVRAASAGYHPYLIRQDDRDYRALVDALAGRARAYALADAEETGREAELLGASIRKALDLPAPSFHAIAYGMRDGRAALPEGDILSINRQAEDLLEKDFLDGFGRDIEKALSHSADLSRRQKRSALETLREVLPVFEKEALSEGEVKAAYARAAAAVEKAIDPLQLEKDNLSYVFKSSMQTNIGRYFTGLKANPGEKLRFERDTKNYERQLAKKRVTSSVVPMNLIDTDMAKGNMVRDIRNLIERYEQQLGAADGPKDRQAEAIVRYLADAANDYGYRLSPAMAKHRSIELMDEVGIPEPHKRFRQYPFEFSGGMRQRIVIAIALSANPDILICDEPTTALDVTIQAQILELINRLKVQRRLSVIFITHDLGVVANMADSIAVMYAGKIVEQGTADEVFYSPAHPYTWALLSSVPDLETREKLAAIPGTPPNMIIPPKGDAFAARNQYALELDFEQEPPMFRITDTHRAATWLLHPDAPKVEPPKIVLERIDRMLARHAASDAEGGIRP